MIYLKQHPLNIPPFCIRHNSTLCSLFVLEPEKTLPTNASKMIVTRRGFH